VPTRSRSRASLGRLLVCRRREDAELRGAPGVDVMRGGTVVLACAVVSEEGGDVWMTIEDALKAATGAVTLAPATLATPSEEVRWCADALHVQTLRRRGNDSVTSMNSVSTDSATASQETNTLFSLSTGNVRYGALTEQSQPGAPKRCRPHRRFRARMPEPGHRSRHPT
jgi:hypothetical protein